MAELGPPPFARGRPRVEEAVTYAASRHAAQRRDSDAAPFLLHLLEVAALLVGREFDDDVVTAGILHDVLEKTDGTLDEIRARFGERTAGLVAAVTEDDSIDSYEERKEALRRQVEQRGHDALAVYAADKLAKTRELRSQAAREHVSLADPALERRLVHYEKSLLLLERAAPDLPFLGQLRFELWALRRLPPEG